MTPRVFAEGSIFAHHRIEELLGKGGMGVVYRATHLTLDRPVALKVISPELAVDQSFQERFKRESRLAASIRHPHVVRIYHAGEDDAVLYITMDYIDGTDLRSTIAESGALAPHHAAVIVSQLAEALDAAHRLGLVHRDVKPANVLLERLGPDYHAFLGDFGLAKQVTSDSAMTRTGLFVGTIDYVSPEQLQGRPVDARSDVYSLGAVLYEALTGQVPYPRDSEASKILAHMQEPPPVVSAVSGETVPKRFDEVVTRAMAKDPDARYLSAGDLGEAALQALTGRALTRPDQSVATGAAAARAGVDGKMVGQPTRTSARASSTELPASLGAQQRRTDRPLGWARRRRAVSLGAATALALICLAAVLLLTRDSQPQSTLLDGVSTVPPADTGGQAETNKGQAPSQDRNLQNIQQAKKVGESAKDDGLTLKVTKLAPVPRFMDIDHGTARPRTGAQFIGAEVVATNEGSRTIDPFCDPDGAFLLDSEKRRFDPVSTGKLETSYLRGNETVCDTGIAPGFSERITLPFEVPKGAKVGGLVIWNDEARTDFVGRSRVLFEP